MIFLSLVANVINILNVHGVVILTRVVILALVSKNTLEIVSIVQTIAKPMVEFAR